jgi:hypothetical protein
MLGRRLATIAQRRLDVRVAHPGPLHLQRNLELAHHSAVGVAESVPAKVRDAVLWPTGMRWFFGSWPRQKGRPVVMLTKTTRLSAPQPFSKPSGRAGGHRG